jgi:bifunctional DNase/RNase
MPAPDDIRVSVKALVPTPQGVGVFLTDGNKVIAVFVDHVVAAAITMFAQQVKAPRPLTHDLLVNVLAGLGARLQKVVICDLKEGTYYARLHLLQENELGRNLVEIDARPSDSIALAIQQRCPVFVARAVWDRSEDMAWALEQAQRAGPGEGEGGGTPKETP